MRNTLSTGMHTSLCLITLALLSGCAENQVVTEAPKPAPQVAIPQAAGPEPTEAKDVLMRMANYLAKLPKYTVNMHDSYDTLQASGEKIEFAETRKITVSRPNGLRVELEESNADKHVFLYDGKDMTVFNPSQKVYAQIPKPGGLDAAIVYLLKDLHMRLPLAALLISRFPAEIESRTQALAYVEKTAIHGVPCHHLAGRTDSVDYQVWIQEGTQPLPLRIVMTYKFADGQPQFRAQFSDWNLQPEVNDALFAFTPPEATRKIAFAAQLDSFTPVGAGNSEQAGEKQ